MSLQQIEPRAAAFGCYVQKKKRSGLKIMPYSRRWFILDLREKVLGYAHDSTGRKKFLKPLDVLDPDPGGPIRRLRERAQVQEKDQDFIPLREERCASLADRGPPAGLRGLRDAEESPRAACILSKRRNHRCAVSIRKCSRL